MPQMSPIDWLVMYFYFIFIYYLMMIFLFFFNFFLKMNKIYIKNNLYKIFW